MIIEAFILIVLLTFLLIPFADSNQKGIIAALGIIINSILSSYLAIRTLFGTTFIEIFPGSFVTGEIPIRIDSLSGWFILILNFTFVTGAIYGIQYMNQYTNQKAKLSIHWISFLLAYSALIAICAIQNGIVFLISWEIMAIASFFLVIFEHEKHDTIKAGLNFLIQSHACIVFLTIGIIWVSSKTNSYDFAAIIQYTSSQPASISFSLFLVFFIGFAIKAGFVPFHTWLPYAHPAAPSHVSGVMSGVIIKIGIYGIFRMLLLIKSNYMNIGYLILFFSLLSGVYGVMLAIIQHNLKKLLAYHSIENIGIIGIGIGVGCIGIGNNNSALSILGFAGALLHTLNHSLFKSLLFYSAGNVYQKTHTMIIDRLGGVGKAMPHTAFLFLIAALAICGLPPFNGFISEFLIYYGMFSGLKDAGFALFWTLGFSIGSLVLIGGLALLCFTKAFGTVFIGSPRHEFKQKLEEANNYSLFPMRATLILIVLIGVFPKYFFLALSEPIHMYTDIFAFNENTIKDILTFESLDIIGYCAFGIYALTGTIYTIRSIAIKNKVKEFGPTWGCGYVGYAPKAQYTASSFIRTYRKLIESVLIIHKRKKLVAGIFPKEAYHETHPYDKIEAWFIDFPLKRFYYFINRFSFLQNGSLQMYIMYGVIFIVLVMAAPLVYETAISMRNFINNF